MLKHIWQIFLRDLKVNTRDFLALYIIIFPAIFAVGVNLFTPSINDTTVNLALLNGDNPEMVAYLQSVANVELFDSVESVQHRVEKRDNIVGILPDGGSYYLMTQGNEPASVVDGAKLIKTLYEQDAQIADSNAEIVEFGRTVPPIKKLLVNIGILLTSILGGMLIGINIVEEKADKTIKAINVTPVSRTSFVLGKSLIGLTVPVIGSLAILWITGFRSVNFGQVVVAVLATTLVSLVVGFLEGLSNDDVISAAGEIKILFLPMGAAIAAAELLSDKWQTLFYWIPFYWTYKGNDAVLSHTATWAQISLYSVIVLALCAVVYFMFAPKIRKGLA